MTNARATLVLILTALAPPAAFAEPAAGSELSPPPPAWLAMPSLGGDAELRTQRANLYRLTDTLVPISLGFAAAHMVDNVISRRTFAAGAVAPTLVQLTYVGGAVAYFFDAGPLFWITFSTAMLTAHSFGHLFRPSAPHHISTFHDAWATGNNRASLASGGVGRVSQGVLIGLDLGMLTVLVSSVRDGVRCGFTLGRNSTCDAQ